MQQRDMTKDSRDKIPEVQNKIWFIISEKKIKVFYKNSTRIQSR